MTGYSKGISATGIGYGLVAAFTMLSAGTASVADATTSIIGQWRIRRILIASNPPVAHCRR